MEKILQIVHHPLIVVSSYIYLGSSLKAYLYLLGLSIILPIPLTTQSIGYSAQKEGIPVSRFIKESIPLRLAQPPVILIPSSMISALSSGGTFSNTFLIASIILDSGSDRASLISADVIVMFSGRPFIAFLPLISACTSSL